MGREGSGEAETGSKWSDGLSERFGMGFGQKIKEKTKKNNDFLNCLLLDFAFFPRIPIQTAGSHLAPKINPGHPWGRGNPHKRAQETEDPQIDGLAW